MIILKHADDVISHLQPSGLSKKAIGFVPTMGALHQGHISLLKKSKQTCDLTVSSIFVNPTQFNNADDFKKYPVTLENDIYILEKNGCDILFLPDIAEIYPGGTVSKKVFDIGYLQNILEGEFRPGHFQGVCQVVSRLLQIVTPTHLFMGQKDYQQCMVIKKLLALQKLNIELVICTTLREENGLAMSSRNLRLTKTQRKQAGELYKTLRKVKESIRPGPIDNLKKEAEEDLLKKNFKPDYVEIAKANNLRIVHNWNGADNLVILVAAFIDDIRLIDNLLLKDHAEMYS